MWLGVERALPPHPCCDSAPVDQELLLRRQHPAAENRMLKASPHRVLDLSKIAVDETAPTHHPDAS